MERDSKLEPETKQKTVYLKPDFHELMKEMTLAYLVQQPPDVVRFAIKFLTQKKFEQDCVNEYSSEGVPNTRRRVRRHSVLAEPIAKPDEDFQPRTYPKTVEQKKMLETAMRRIVFFQDLDLFMKNLVMNSMKSKRVKKGEVIIKQGEPGDNFYVVEEGVYEAFDGQGDQKRILKTYNQNGFFGEIALMYNVPRACSVRAKTNGLLWELDRHTFRNVVLSCNEKKLKMHKMLIENVEMLNVLDDEERHKLADSLISKTFSEGECIIRQGDLADGMYFVEHGHVRVAIRLKDGREREVGRVYPGQYFGELALLTYKPRAASVYAVGAVRVAFLNVDTFERLLGRCADVLRRKTETYRDQLHQLSTELIDIPERR